MEKSISGDFKIVEEPKKTLAMEPKKFAMWLFLGSVVMLFAALTSGYIVRRAEGNWLFFELPVVFYYNTVVIILSSITMQWAYFAAKKDNLPLLKLLVAITSLLGVSFLVGQVYGWGDMAERGIYLVGNPSGSFVIALTFVHGLHLISGVVFLLLVLISTFRFQVHSKSMLKLELCTTYWHFLGGLWLYLFVFLLLYR